MIVDDFTIARVLHVAAIVGWIGGVWFVTFVVMPAIRKTEAPENRLKAFHHIEQGFHGDENGITRRWAPHSGNHSLA